MLPKPLLLTLGGLALAVVPFSLGGIGPDIPPPPAPDWPLFDALEYDGEAAAELWEPMAGSPRVSIASRGGQRLLKLPCNFAGTRHERASWDREIELDLACTQGVQFQLYCADPSPISHFTFYLRSGEGWYARNFFPPAGRWSTIAVERSQAQVEGSPAGWSRIDAIRFSAWRTQDVDTEVYVSGLGLLGADTPIIVLRGDSLAGRSPDEARSVRTYTANVVRCLEELDLPHCVLSDLELEGEHLVGRELVVLPHNDGMSEAARSAVAGFLEGGGKLIGFYALDPELLELCGMRAGAFVRQEGPGSFAIMRAVDPLLPELPEVVRQASWNIRTAEPLPGRGRVAARWYDSTGKDTGHPAIVVTDNATLVTHVLLEDGWETKQQLVLALVQHLAPELLRGVAQVALEGIGTFGSFEGFEDACRDLERASRRDPRVRHPLLQARIVHQLSSSQLADDRYAAAIRSAHRAEALLVEAWCLAQEPLAGEHRAFWCHSAFGVQGMSWEEAIATLADNGFTAVLPNMLWGGAAFHASEVLPVHESVAERGDQIAECLAACRKHGVECHVWKVNWNMGRWTPADFVAAMSAAGRTQVGFDGSPQERWLCPSHPENRKLEIDSMVEVARRYEVAGLHFDYIRYPDPDHCFCDGCRERFEEAIGRRVPGWPGEVRGDEALRRRWLDFRRDNVTAVVAAVAEAARAARPGIEISATVFRRWPIDADGVGQDWKLWCERGWLDFVCPMDYTHENSQFEALVAHQLEVAGGVPCYPGIGLSVWPERGDVVKLIEQIGVTRRLRTGGFTVFNLGVAEAREVLPVCGLGITRGR